MLTIPVPVSVQAVFEILFDLRFARVAAASAAAVAVPVLQPLASRPWLLCLSWETARRVFTVQLD